MKDMLYRVGGFGASQHSKVACHRLGLNDKAELLETFSEAGPNFTGLKPKRKGAFWGVVLRSDEGRDYFVKKINPEFGLLVPEDNPKNTQLMYHLGTKLGIKMPEFRYKKTPTGLWGISAGLSRKSAEKSYSYRDYSDAKALNYLSAICRARKYDRTSVDSIARFLLLSSLCRFFDLHENNFGVVTSRRKGLFGAVKRKFALVDCFVNSRVGVTGLPEHKSRRKPKSLKSMLLFQNPNQISSVAPEIAALIRNTPEADLRRASRKFFDSFAKALKESEQEVARNLGAIDQAFVSKLRRNFVKLDSWYRKLPRLRKVRPASRHAQVQSK